MTLIHLHVCLLLLRMSTAGMYGFMAAFWGRPCLFTSGKDVSENERPCPCWERGAIMSIEWSLRFRFQVAMSLTVVKIFCELAIRMDPLKHSQIPQDKKVSAFQPFPEYFDVI